MSRIRIYDKDQPITKMEKPFNVKFSFEKLFDYWKELSKSKDKGVASQAKEVLKKLEHAKELHRPFEDENIIIKYEEEIKLLMSHLFPTQLEKNEIKAGSMPFLPIYFNPTERFHNIMDQAGEDFNMQFRNLDPAGMYIGACVFLLNFKFGANLDYKRSVFLDIPDQQGLMRHYRILFNGDFTTFHVNKDFKGLSDEDLKLLMDNADNLKLWKEKIPPKSFTFEGFAIMNLFDVTYEEVISSLKADLLKKDALQSPELIESIQSRIRELYNMPGLQLGFAAFDSNNAMLKSLGFTFWNSIIMDGVGERKCSDLLCSHSYDHLIKDKKSLAISCIDHEPKDSPFVAKLSKKGLQSYIAYPLKYNDEFIGMLELGSPKPYKLNSVVSAKLDEIAPLFTIAMKRMLDEHETLLEAIVQEKFTAIHPAVSWRFFEAAENLHQKRQVYEAEDIEAISFKNVYPLYGQSDIKNSSTERNKGIQADLIDQLNQASKVLDKAMQLGSLPIYQELNFRIKKCIENLKGGLNAGDELNLLDFLKVEVNPVFDHLKAQNPEMKSVVEEYTNLLDPELGVIYNKRKDFEQSVTLLNEKISDFLEKKQDQAQEMFPHYFEKYQTDGVEYNMYMGQSLVNSQQFDQVYLRNLRLWQLITTVEIENVIDRYREHFPLPLQICSLILVHSTPMAIKFSMDEKQFDVDGAYNIRYEIVKKRIDKAYVKGTKERLTQPHKIAIVYSQDKEAQEYVKYLEYLQSIEYIGDEIEWLELQDLQGASGLKALRVAVRFDIQSEEVEKGTASQLAKVGK